VDRPFVSVVIRSFQRPAALAELLQAVLSQDYPRFEVVVVEQTQSMREAEASRLASLELDGRLRILRFPPLGGARARNEGARAARGEILLFLDDDDLPADGSWIAAHAENYGDPGCLAVTGRSLVEGVEFPPAYQRRAQGKVLSLVPLFMWQRVFAGCKQRARVQSIHGTNSSVRRLALERVGLWDECTTVEDEMSFTYRLRSALQPGEHMLFDPQACIMRRLHLPGGLEKRWYPIAVYAEKVFLFYHNVVAHYFPGRFWSCYPLFVAWIYGVSLDWIWQADNMRYRGRAHKIWTSAWLLVAFPFLWMAWLGRLAVHRLAFGPPQHQPRLDPIRPPESPR